jgi:hypothetical protein
MQEHKSASGFGRPIKAPRGDNNRTPDRLGGLVSRNSPLALPGTSTAKSSGVFICEVTMDVIELANQHLEAYEWNGRLL